ncbi:MAG: Bug family tripartite tricarboxylate transporter substrate binding protein [Burkholderiales bacterium]
MRIAKFLASIALLLVCAQSTAQDFPTKALRVIVPAAGGNPFDLRARQLSAKFPEVLGQSLVVENRPGGNQFIGAEAAARAPADGYTLFLAGSSTMALNPWLFRKMPYRPDEDFTPVAMLSSGPLVLVVSSGFPARDLAELIALAKAKPGQLNYATGGTRGSPEFLVMEQIKRATGIDVVGVPYKVMGAELPNLMTGQVPIAFNFWTILGAYVKSGKLRALAVAGAKRLAVAPEVPTFAEAGLPGIEYYGWNGIFVPAGTPRAIVVQLHGAVARILQMPDIRDQILEGGSEVGGKNPDEFAAFVRTERARFGKLVADAGITPE